MDDIIAFAELGHYMRLPLRTCSADMTARFMSAVATTFHTDIVLWDQHIAAGGKRFATRAYERLKQPISRAGMLVLASYSQDVLRLHRTTHIRMDRGRIIAQAPVNDMLSDHNSNSEGLSEQKRTI